MKRIKKLIGIVLLALVVSLGTPQAFAADGTAESPGVTAPTNGTAESPGIVVIILDYLALMLS
ncbi:MAG TPA: hypothetical protein VF708_02160 [Pyrinomonadaceae bacterium]|jgi:hypothetical protein